MVLIPEGIDSEQVPAGAVRASLSLRDFFGLASGESIPDHSSLCRIRQRLTLEVRHEVFVHVLGLLEKAHLLAGKYPSIDASGMGRRMRP